MAQRLAGSRHAGAAAVVSWRGAAGRGRMSHAPARHTAAPTIDSGATCSPRTATPSASATTGMKNTVAEARVGAEAPGGHRHDHVGDRRAEGAERDHREQRSGGPVRVEQGRQAQWRRDDRGHAQRPPHHGQRAAAHLQRTRQVDGGAVGGHRGDDHRDARGAAGAVDRRARPSARCRRRRRPGRSRRRGPATAGRAGRRRWWR